MWKWILYTLLRIIGIKLEINEEMHFDFIEVEELIFCDSNFFISLNRKVLMELISLFFVSNFLR